MKAPTSTQALLELAAQHTLPGLPSMRPTSLVEIEAAIVARVARLESAIQSVIPIAHGFLPGTRFQPFEVRLD
jgi:hypothetical protein